jgi:hypothetical protein
MVNSGTDPGRTSATVDPDSDRAPESDTAGDDDWLAVTDPEDRRALLREIVLRALI